MLRAHYARFALRCVIAIGLLRLGTATPVTKPIHATQKQNLTLYHVNPKKYKGVANMNTGDAAGDALFQLRSVTLPVACADKSGHHYGNECDNPESVPSPDLTITRVLVEVTMPLNDTGYARCNICLNGTVPMTRPPMPCTGDEYVCVCGGFFDSSPTCALPVGRENPSQLFSRFPVRAGSPNYEFWQHNVATALSDGYWYSTLQPSEGKTWRLVETQKRILSSCHDDHMFASLRGKGSDCFDGCAQPQNQTSPCFIDCVFQTLLGKDAGSSSNPTGGMSGAEITKLWTDPFEICPSI